MVGIKEVTTNIIKYLENINPYSELVFTMKIDEVKQVIQDDIQRGRVGGCVARLGYQAAINDIKELFEDCDSFEELNNLCGLFSGNVSN